MSRDDPSSGGVRRLGVALAVLWTLAVAVAMTWNAANQRKMMREAATETARTSFHKDVTYRRWNAAHGGVYAPITETTPPNPHLDVEERELETPSGRRLTLVNPAYMTRQVHELELKAKGVRGHISSLDPIRPGNAPDGWERSALECFERGETEVVSVETLDGAPHLRLMRPFVTEKGCLRCHAAQGYEEGDIRGGISISVPMAPYTAEARRQTALLGAGHGVLWILGLLCLTVALKRVRDHEADLHRERDQYESLVSNIPGVTYRCAPDRDWTMLYMSRQVDRLSGYPASDFIDNAVRTYESVLHRDDTGHVARSVSEAVAAGKLWDIEYRVRHRDGSIRWAREKGRAVRGPGGEVEFLDGFILDITEHKRAEAEVQSTLAETRRVNRLMTGREDRVLELKTEVNELLAEHGREPRYRSVT